MLVIGNVIHSDADRFVIDEGNGICTYSREYYSLSLEPATKLVYGLHAVAAPVYEVRAKRKRPHETAAKQNTLASFYRKRRKSATWTR